MWICSREQLEILWVNFSYTNNSKNVKLVYLVPGDLQTGPLWLYRSPALDTPRWQTADSSYHHIWCPTLHFSTPPLGPHLQWPHHEDEPTVAEKENSNSKTTYLKPRILFILVLSKIIDSGESLEPQFFLFCAEKAAEAADWLASCLYNTLLTLRGLSPFFSIFCLPGLLV